MCVRPVKAHQHMSHLSTFAILGTFPGTSKKMCKQIEELKTFYFYDVERVRQVMALVLRLVQWF